MMRSLFILKNKEKLFKMSEKNMKTNPNIGIVKFSLLDPDDSYALPSYEESDSRNKNIASSAPSNT